MYIPRTIITILNNLDCQLIIISMIQRVIITVLLYCICGWIILLVPSKLIKFLLIASFFSFYSCPFPPPPLLLYTLFYWYFLLCCFFYLSEKFTVFKFVSLRLSLHPPPALHLKCPTYAGVISFVNCPTSRNCTMLQLHTYCRSLLNSDRFVTYVV